MVSTFFCVVSFKAGADLEPRQHLFSLASCSLSLSSLTTRIIAPPPNKTPNRKRGGSRRRPSSRPRGREGKRKGDIRCKQKKRELAFLRGRKEKKKKKKRRSPPEARARGRAPLPDPPYHRQNPQGPQGRALEHPESRRGEQQREISGGRR